MFHSLSLCSTRHLLLRVVHKDIKHLHCVGPIWVLPWWLHALMFSHKVRRVSTRYNSLLIVSICLQRCCWVSGLDWDMCKEWFKPCYPRKILDGNCSSAVFVLLIKSQKPSVKSKKKKKKSDFWLHGQSFYITENTFQPPTHTAAFIPFPFFLCFPGFGHMSFPHGALLWCGVLCVPGACTLSHPQPVRLAIFESWHYMLAPLHHWLLRSLALVLISAPSGLPLRYVTSEAVNPPQSLNGFKTTHSFRCECFLT